MADDVKKTVLQLIESLKKENAQLKEKVEEYDKAMEEKVQENEDTKEFVSVESYSSDSDKVAEMIESLHIRLQFVERKLSETSDEDDEDKKEEKVVEEEEESLDTDVKKENNAPSNVKTGNPSTEDDGVDPKVDEDRPPEVDRDTTKVDKPKNDSKITQESKESEGEEAEDEEGKKSADKEEPEPPLTESKKGVNFSEVLGVKSMGNGYDVLDTKDGSGMKEAIKKIKLF